MDYKPITGVWEVTMACNMRCKHCGSSCTTALPGELTTDEALNVCDQLGEAGLTWITLSGGEPLLRKDWHIIAQRLTENNVIPTMISNGWLFNEELAEKAVKAKVDTIAISIDGTEKTHDFIRKPGSFNRIIKAYDIMKPTEITSAAITTINKMNISQLPALKDLLIEHGVQTWQLQIGIPMGNMGEHREMLIGPELVDEVIDFAYNVKDHDKIRICLADCIGYYNNKEMQVRRRIRKDDSAGYEWTGCNAGKYSFGILHNGDLLGCTSIRDKSFIEGNLKERTLKELWDDAESFKWNREMKKEKLSGFCNKCVYGSSCLGGCPNTRLTFENDVYGENKFCSYSVAMKKVERSVNNINDTAELYKRGISFLKKSQLQLAEMFFNKLLKEDENNIEYHNHYGFINYMLGNYHIAKTANEKALSLDPENAYANKGMGLTLAKLDQVDKGIEFLKKSIRLADDDFMDPYFDLAVTYLENDNKKEALRILEEGRAKSDDFVSKSNELYKQLIS